MAGQIEKRGTGRYRIRWFLGRDERTGKRVYRSKTIRGTRKDADKALREQVRQVDMGVLVEARPMTVDAYLDEWLEASAEKRLRARTARDYRDLLERYVRPYVGPRKLSRLTPLDVQRMVAALEERGLSAKTIRNAHQILQAALSQAVRWRMLAVNPAAAVELPRVRQREMQALSVEEVARFRKAVAGTRHEALFLTLLGTGMRPGEALALRWSDLDLGAGRVVVRRTLPRGKHGGDPHFEEPKTRRGLRVVPLPASVARALAAHKARQAEERLRVGVAYAELGLVFATPLGQPLSDRNVVNRHFKPALERAGLPSSLRLYDLRHTAATLMLASGAHAKAVSERLGHARSSFTLDAYAHVLEPMEAEATERLEAALFGGEGGA